MFWTLEETLFARFLLSVVLHYDFSSPLALLSVLWMDLLLSFRSGIGG